MLKAMCKTGSIAAVMLLFTACAGPRSDQVLVHYQTDPSYALLEFADGTRTLSPASYYFAKTDAFRAGGCMKIQGPKVTWRSGAWLAAPPSVDVCAVNGTDQVWSARRPSSPGIQLDYQFAAETERSIRAAADAAAAAAAPPIYFPAAPQSGATTLLSPSAPVPAPLHCVTKRGGMFGDQLVTDCR